MARRAKPTTPAAALQALEARLKPDFKRAIGAGVIALGCLVAGVDLGGVNRHGSWRWLVVGLTIGSSCSARSRCARLGANSIESRATGPAYRRHRRFAR